MNVLLSTEPQAAGGHCFGTFRINRSSEPGQTGPSSSATEHVDHWNTNHSAAREPLCVSYTTTTPSTPQVQREMSRKDKQTISQISVQKIQKNVDGVRTHSSLKLYNQLFLQCTISVWSKKCMLCMHHPCFTGQCCSGSMHLE